MKIDPHTYRVPSRHSVVYAKRGMVCSTQPLVTSIGIQTLEKGGNAVDAALAMAGAMPVIEPMCNGIGGDAFALIWTGGRLYGLNASGISPKALNAAEIRARGFETIPDTGWTSVLVPGAPAGWAAAHRRFGSLPLAELWAPAIRAAREGFPLQPNLEAIWRAEWHKVRTAAARDGEEPYRGWFETFAPEGTWPKAGDLIRSPGAADTLQELAGTGCRSFYRGALAEKICRFSEETGGFFTKEDLETYEPLWVEPIHTDYRGYDVFEIPPNGHGITALMALNILKGFDLGSDRDDPEVWHRLIEALKLAFIDTRTYVADPRAMRTRVEDLLSEEYAARRRALIGEKALLPVPGEPAGSDTVYFCTADDRGNMVSWIQSNYENSGSGIVIPGTGIALQDRAMGFSMDQESDNFVEGGKRSYHTIIPGFLCKDGEPVGPFGVMGGFMQPQGHLMVVVNTVDFGMNPQEALDWPRFQWTGGRKVQLEPEVPEAVRRSLEARGHEIEVVKSRRGMGRGQIIWRTEGGMLCGGTEPRADGSVGVL